MVSKGWKAVAGIGLVGLLAAACTPQWDAVLRGEGGGMLGPASAPVAPAASAPVAAKQAPSPAPRVLPPPVEPAKAPPESPRQEGSIIAELNGLIFNYFYAHVGRRLVVQTDKPLYRPLEAIWVRSLDVELRTLRGFAADTGLLYQLVDPAGKVVAQKVVRQIAGRAANDLVIPPGVPSGAYRLRVSTEDSVVGVASLVILGAPLDSAIAGAPAAPRPRLQVESFPEGGALVAGLLSRVAFEARDAAGAPVRITGRVQDDRGRTLAEIEASPEGRGRFALQPEAGRSYAIHVTAPEALRGAFPLPAVQAEGCTLESLADPDSQRSSVRVLVRCHAPATVLVTALLREVLVDVAYVFVEPGKPAVVFLRSKDEALNAAPGVVRVTVWDDWMEPLAERLVYRNRRERLDLQIIPEADALQPGDVARLHIFARDSQGRPVQGPVALSVVDDALALLGDDAGVALPAQALLLPDLLGPLTELRPYFDLDDPGSGEALDLLMATRGHRAFDWKRAVEARDANDAGVPARSRSSILYPAPAFPEPAEGDLAPASPEATARARELQARLLALGPDYRDNPAPQAPPAAPGGAAAAPPASAAPPPVGAARSDDGAPATSLRREDVRATIDRYQGPLGRCATGSTVTVQVRLQVEPSGQVSAAEVTNEARGTPEAACVEAVARTFTFPSWQGERLALTYPFVLKGQGWAPARRFPVPDLQRPLLARQRDARETVLWLPEVALDADGHAVVEVPLPNLDATWRVSADALLAGLPAAAQVKLTTARPFHADAALPARAAVGDRFEVPVRVRARGEQPLQVTITAEVQGGLTQERPGPVTVAVPAGGEASAAITLRAQAPGGASVRIFATQGASVVELAQQLEVVAPGAAPPLAAARGGLVAEGAPLGLVVPAGGAPVDARVRAFPEPLGLLLAARQGLGQQEVGLGRLLGLAWTTARALAWHRASGSGDSDDAASLALDLQQLAAELSAHRTASGGLSAAPGLPPDLAWTALGVRVLLAWEEAAPGATGDALSAAVAWLRSQRDGAGGLRGADAGGLQSAPEVNALVIWAVAGAGLEGFNAEADALLRDPPPSPLALALAADLGWSVPRLRARALDPTRRLAALQGENGAWAFDGPGAFGGGPARAKLHIAALALRVFAGSGASYAPTRSAAAWLVSHQRADAGWGDAASTLLALMGLEVYDSHGARPPSGGSLEVSVNDAAPFTRPYAKGQARALTLTDLGANLGAGGGSLTVKHLGRGELHILAAATRPAPAGPPGPLTLAASLSAPTLPRGGAATLSLTVTAPAAARRVLGVLSLPAGLRVGDLPPGFAALPDGRVGFALEGVAPGQPRALTLPVTGAVPGTFQGGSVEAWIEGADAPRSFAPCPGVTVQ